ncbi:hypothetical protein N7462_001312 [Penicillium macrosclerotiorum]|uniref:uncharacterized protein n=1 Tax=Penicillium macrosclerotiorum TaxID=303699 RepID=UPI0025471935|nr:uncharacterized protein N7462_001312 [Penicillium macrosclerotiorum]KAJ5691889.1 hypothetical protein N7462_001312 [Penicillium macrosclerotiorum]
MLEPIVQDEGAKAVVGLLKCKQLAKIIKARRTPPWPTPVTSDLPPKEVADALVDIYLRTYETIYRVLHIPSFKRDYDALWLPGKIHDTAFLVQLKLIFAIGATMYDDHFTLRTSAIRWVHEAQTWSSEPEFKSRLTIQFLQTSILLLLARESVGVDGSLTWISVGNVMRTAMHMGLHRDPLVQAKRTLFSSEMRRRLWNTIVELALQTSMESGGPPLLSMEDFDTQPPGNFDDDQIESEDPTPKPEGIFTGMSIALSLRQMFPLRLDIARSLNALGMQRGYEETLRLDSELRACYKTVCMTLQRHRLVNSSAQTAFGVHALDFIINRYIIGLHSPYFSASHKGVAFAFSRKVVVETALKIWSAVYPSSIMAPSPFEDPSRPKNDYLTRLARCGYGVFRKSPMQACFLVAAELRAQLQEEHSLGPVPLRRDLLSVLEDGKKWSLNSITAGETNIKGYLFLSWVDTLIHGMVRGIPKDQFPEILMKTGEDVVAQCLEIFEQKLDENPDLVGVNVDNLDELAFDISPDWIDSWGFLVSVKRNTTGIKSCG